ncbi:protein of unknown function [Quadrisphaera granulorum]|uniref:Uncharacterized protein DUF4062 n=1 Tax=Quadrisphaera granulorum TaxID=317664 RepID=A0A315ZN36_9ACTN|nr:DUF4062 domain-containing protein [Quadrisphaera granulorum]PWJ46916.1 uncharacterized protein DUF4062 [Quadrisphaera granulorum]SZE99008.1 protein of unknown function [Quadrisphaera granulorum]
MVDRVHSVFVSSTFTDLRAERLAVTDVLLRSKCLPAGMELFASGSRAPWQTITRSLDLADYMVLILAGRYGSLRKGTDLGYTHSEYRYALERGIPVLPFLIKDIDDLPGHKVELQTRFKKKLADFRQEVLDGDQTCLFWSTEAQLREQVAFSIAAAKDDFPRPGWVRGDAPASGGHLSEDPADSLPIRVEIDDRIPLAPLTDCVEDFRRFVEAQQQGLLDAIPEPKPPTPAPPAGAVLSVGAFAGLAEQLRQSGSTFGLKPEDRSQEQYRAEVSAYGTTLAKALPTIREQMAARVLAPLIVNVTNPERKNLAGVELVLHIEGDVRAVPVEDIEDGWDPKDDMPTAPRKWGPRSTWASTDFLASISGADFPLGSLARQVQIEHDGSVTLRYPPFDLRPKGGQELSSVVLLVPDGAARTRRATWIVTATNRDGLAEGELTLDFSAAPRNVWRDWWRRQA